jgi:hypothetical protein
MENWLMRLGGEIIPIVAILTGLIIAVTAILAGTWRKNRQTELESAMKQDMLNRGMSAQDIERIIKATKPEE